MPFHSIFCTSTVSEKSSFGVLCQKNPHLARQTRFFFLVLAQNLFVKLTSYFFRVPYAVNI